MHGSYVGRQERWEDADGRVALGRWSAQDGAWLVTFPAVQGAGRFVSFGSEYAARDALVADGFRYQGSSDRTVSWCGPSGFVDRLRSSSRVRDLVVAG